MHLCRPTLSGAWLPRSPAPPASALRVRRARLCRSLTALFLGGAAACLAQDLGVPAKVKIKLLDPDVKITRLSAANEQTFFAYYDLPAFDATTSRHLANRVPFRDRMPTADDTAELGTIATAGKFEPFARTQAWNFQQGALLQWLGGASNRVFYNEINPARDGYRGVLHDLGTGARTYTDRALANLSRDGRWGLGVDFDRLHDFRPGYGYALRDDPHEKVPHPDDDGIWLCDLSTGRSHLILSLAAICAQVHHLAPELQMKLLINHITFNPSADRFIFLLRNFPPAKVPPTVKRAWRDVVLTADREGKNVRVLVAPGYASHYHWRDDTTLVFHSDGPQGPQLYEITDTATPKFTALDPAFFPKDGHCSYSPDGRWMLYDSYPDKEGMQHLYLYNLAAKKGVDLAAFAALPVPIVDIRCDLHPRWIDASRVSFDSTHEGCRGIYLADLRAVQERESRR